VAFPGTSSRIGKGVSEAKIGSGKKSDRAVDFIRLMSQKGSADSGGGAILMSNDGCYVVARVGGHVITNTDLLTEIRFMFFVAGKEFNKEVAKQMVLPVLHAKISEALRMHIAKRIDISVTDSDIDDRIKQLATWNGTSRAELEARLLKCGIGKNAFRQWVRTQLLYPMIAQALAGEIKVSAKEIASAKAKYALDMKKLRYKIVEIFLSADGGAVQNVKRLIDDGFNFQVLAQALSQSSRVKLGEDWVSDDALDSLTRGVVRPLRIGQYGGPIDTGTGVKFVYVVDIAAPGQEGESSGSYKVLRTTLRQGGLLFTKADAKRLEDSLTTLSNASSVEEYKAICERMNIKYKEVTLENSTGQEAAMAANSKASGHPCISSSATESIIIVMMYVGTQCKAAKMPDDKAIEEMVSSEKFERMASLGFKRIKGQVHVMINLENLGKVVR
jgi:hypothetical protein